MITEFDIERINKMMNGSASAGERLHALIVKLGKSLISKSALVIIGGFLVVMFFVIGLTGKKEE